MKLVSAVNDNSRHKFLVDYYLEDTDRVFYCKTVYMPEEAKAYELNINYVRECSMRKKCPGCISKECSGYEYEYYNRTTGRDDQYFDGCNSGALIYLDKDCNIEIKK